MSKGSNDATGIDNIFELSGKFTALRESLQRLDEQILALRRCIIYMYNEIENNNQIINRYIFGNGRRLELVKEFNEKMDLLVDQRDAVYKEYIDLIPNHEIPKINDDFKRIFDVSKINLNKNT